LIVKTAITVFSALVSVYAISATIDEKIINNLPLNTIFKHIGDRDGEGDPSEGSMICAWRGSFSAAGKNELVIHIETTTSYAELSQEVWLLRRAGRSWLPKIRLGHADEIDLQFCDVNGNGTDEILVTETFDVHGHNREFGNLFTWIKGKAVVMFSYEDQCELYDAHHSFIFMDLDKDGKQELIEQTDIDYGYKAYHLNKMRYRYSRLLTERFENTPACDSLFSR
jgi:hypothetical protein